MEARARVGQSAHNNPLYNLDLLKRMITFLPLKDAARSSRISKAFNVAVQAYFKQDPTVFEEALIQAQTKYAFKPIFHSYQRYHPHADLVRVISPPIISVDEERRKEAVRLLEKFHALPSGSVLQESLQVIACQCNRLIERLGRANNNAYVHDLSNIHFHFAIHTPFSFCAANLEKTFFNVRQKTSLHGFDFSGTTIKNMHIGFEGFGNCDFSYAQLSGPSFDTTIFFELCRFNAADIQDSFFRKLVDATSVGSDKVFKLCSFDYAQFNKLCLDQIEFDSCGFQNANISEILATSIIFTGRCQFNSVMAHKARFVKTVWSGSCFDQADLSDAGFVSGEMCDANYWNSRLDNIKFKDIALTDVGFNETSLQCALFENVQMYKVTFISCNLTGATFHASQGKSFFYELIRFAETNLTNTVFSNISIFRASFIGNQMYGVTIRGDVLRADFSGADFSHAKAMHATFKNVCLKRASFSNADLTCAAFSDVDLRDADFNAACLNGANLAGADLRGANFTDANLEGADLTGANLGGVTLTHANLRNCKTTKFKSGLSIALTIWSARREDRRGEKEQEKDGNRHLRK